MPKVLTFNGSSLNSNGIYTTEFEDADAPEHDVKVHKILGGGLAVGDDEYHGKTIPVSGYIQGTSVANLESLIDSFHALLAVKNKNLDVDYNGSTRRYIATPFPVKVRRGRHNRTSAPFDITFITTGYGRDTTTTTLVNAQTHTGTTKTNSLSIAGSAPEQMIRTQITVTAATGLTNKTIAVENDTTGEIISITRTWTVGEVLIIDYAARTVKVNGVEVDFSGAFPNFGTGSHDHIITNDFSTRTLTVTIDHIRRYL